MSAEALPKMSNQSGEEDMKRELVELLVLINLYGGVEINDLNDMDKVLNHLYNQGLIHEQEMKNIRKSMVKSELK